MQRSWHVFVTLSVLAFLSHTESGWAHAKSEDTTDAGSNPFLLAQIPAPSASVEQTEFNIPPQPLGPAVTAFADQANYRLLVTSDMTEGLNTNGVTGRYTPEEAMILLLAGTGLGYRLTEARTITLERAPIPPALVPLNEKHSPGSESLTTVGRAQDTKKPVKVPEVVVKDVRDHDYTAEDASTATKIPVPIQETPRSIEVVTRQVMEDQKLFDCRMRSETSAVCPCHSPKVAGADLSSFEVSKVT